MKKKTVSDTQESASLHALGSTPEGQTCSQPTVEGWWWYRERSDGEEWSEWACVQTAMHDGKLCTEPEHDEFGYKYNEVRSGGPGWRAEWAGPLTPPGGATSVINKPSSDK